MDSFEVHNVRVFNDFLICPSYGSQVTIVDAKRPANMIEVANFTTGTSLCWDAVPFLPSGNILAADKNNGLYILKPMYIRACYLEGSVKDSVTLQTINSALVEILNTPVAALSGFYGNYKTGTTEAGTYCVQFSAVGYDTKIVSNVKLTNGVLTQLDVLLSSTGNVAHCIEPNEAGGVFPNPVHSTAVIKFSNVNLSSGIQFVIYNIMGRKVSEIEIPDVNEFTFDRRTLPDGIYIYKLISGNNVYAVGKIAID